MRWDALFADMELQLASAAAQERASAVADLTRAERAAVLLADRLRACVGAPVRVTLRAGSSVEGALTDVGPAWMLVVAQAREHLVPLGAVVSLSGIPAAAAPREGAALRRLGLGHALRAVSRDRSLVRVTTVGSALHGRLDAVGADHVDVALAFQDSGRPTGEVQVVLFAALDLVTSL